ncbi:MAG: Hpt domain-containing protein [Alphaproteobacteria bacterium]|nr:Hpt domain-containing protein [Alphaproteobacteria bacterium]
MSDEKLEIINPPNALKQKVGTGGPGAVDLEALERAEQVIAGMTDSYLEWVVEDLKKIEAAYNALASASGDGREEMQAVFQVAHDIKGQGGSFGYDMMTAIGNELCRFIEKSKKSGPGEIEAIKLHVDSMKLVIAEDIQGNGGKQGEQMLAGLQKVCDKLIS